jgi:hypothetical protein
VTEFCVVLGHSEFVLVLDEVLEALKLSICTRPELTDLEIGYCVVEQGTVTVPLMELTPLNVPVLFTVTVVLVELTMVMPVPTCQATLDPAGKLATE